MRGALGEDRAAQRGVHGGQAPADARHDPRVLARLDGVEMVDWLDPLFEERLETREGRMLVPDRPGLGITLSERCRALTADPVVLWV